MSTVDSLRDWTDYTNSDKSIVSHITPSVNKTHVLRGIHDSRRTTSIREKTEEDNFDPYRFESITEVSKGNARIKVLKPKNGSKYFEVTFDGKWVASSIRERDADEFASNLFWKTEKGKR